MTKSVLWRPSTAPEQLRTLLTLKLPAGTTLPPSPQLFRQALFAKIDDLVEEALKDSDPESVSERVQNALPGEWVDRDEPGSWADAIVMSDQMMLVLGSIDWAQESGAHPLLTKDELDDLADETLGDVLAKL